ncbi:MAG TPA: TraR/DksA C4-type zinc finger protein [Candidatus Methylomirabilis sp.]|nr:TraR/DksA C4-type zinc finger protein [Candidatus Methylomirabilis sp.]
MKSTRTSELKSQESRRRGTPERAEALTETLQEHRRRIREELDGVIRELREGISPDTGDAGDRAAAQFDCELRSARVDQLTQMLQQIDAALSRHAAGRYGRCLACEVDIPVARLRSLPFALYCRECQAAAEENRHGLVGSIA